MKIIEVALGSAVIPQAAYIGNLVTDGLNHYFYDQAMSFWALPAELFNQLTLYVNSEKETLEVTKDTVSITDLLALKTTFHTDDIIKLKENNLL